MTLELKADVQKFVEEQVKSGKYDSLQGVVEAGLAVLQQQNREADFAPGELDRLLTEGLADLETGNVFDGEAVFDELDRVSDQRRQDRSK